MSKQYDKVVLLTFGQHLGSSIEKYWHRKQVKKDIENNAERDHIRVIYLQLKCSDSFRDYESLNTDSKGYIDALNEDDANFLRSLTSASKIIIAGHSSFSTDYFVSDADYRSKILSQKQKHYVHYLRLADFLANYLNWQELMQPESRRVFTQKLSPKYLRISLFSCCAASSFEMKDPKQSMAAKLHKALLERDIYCDVKARATVIKIKKKPWARITTMPLSQVESFRERSYLEQKSFAKYEMEIVHKDPATTFLFKYDVENVFQQSCICAYNFEDWLEKLWVDVFVSWNFVIEEPIRWLRLELANLCCGNYANSVLLESCMKILERYWERLRIIKTEDARHYCYRLAVLIEEGRSVLASAC